MLAIVRLRACRVHTNSLLGEDTPIPFSGKMHQFPSRGRYCVNGTVAPARPQVVRPPCSDSGAFSARFWLWLRWASVGSTVFLSPYVSAPLLLNVSNFYICSVTVFFLIFSFFFRPVDAAVPQVPAQAPRAGGLPGDVPEGGGRLRVQEGHHRLYRRAHHRHPGDQGTDLEEVQSTIGPVGLPFDSSR